MPNRNSQQRHSPAALQFAGRRPLDKATTSEEIEAVFRQCALIFLVLGAAGTARADLYDFGAIAFDQDSGAWGYSYNSGSRQQAAAQAMQHCKGACKVIGEFWNNCGALAANKDGAYGWDGNIDENAATDQALANCNKHGTGCQIKVTVCNDVPSSPPPTSGSKERFIGRHGCWYADWTRIPGCKD